MLFLVISCILILLSLALSSIIVFILFKILCYFLLFLISYIINLDLKKYRLQLFLIDHERIVYKYFNNILHIYILFIFSTLIFILFYLFILNNPLNSFSLMVKLMNGVFIEYWFDSNRESFILFV